MQNARLTNDHSKQMIQFGTEHTLPRWAILRLVHRYVEAWNSILTVLQLQTILMLLLTPIYYTIQQEDNFILLFKMVGINWNQNIYLKYLQAKSALKNDNESKNSNKWNFEQQRPTVQELK